MPRHPEELVNRQILRWQEESRVPPPAAAPEARAAHRPVICISREYGGRGAAIGRLAAERLGFAFYDRELVDQIAQEAHIRRQVVESLDERARTDIADWIEQVFAGFPITNDTLFQNLSRVVLTIAHHGRAVIVGRGAHFLLDPAATLRVRAYAPLETRVARIAERDGVPTEIARETVLRIDAERNTFCRLYFNRNPLENAHHDLLLNTGSLSENVCADLIVAAFRARFA